MIKNDEKSNARLLLEAYELVGIVVDRYLDVIEKQTDLLDAAAHKDGDWDKYAERSATEEKRVEPFDEIHEAILKQLVFELDNGAGRLSWCEDVKK